MPGFARLRRLLVRRLVAARGMRLRVQVALLVALAVAPFCLLAMHEIWEEYERAVRAATPAALAEARALAERLDGKLAEADGLLAIGAVAVAAELEHAHAAATVPALLVRLASVMPRDTVPLAFFDPTGRFAGSSAEPKPGGRADVADREWFLRAAASLGLVVSEPLVSRVSGQRVVVFARSVRNTEGRLLGVLTLRVGMDALAELVNASHGSEREAWIQLGEGVVEAGRQRPSTELLLASQALIAPAEGRSVVSGERLSGGRRLARAWPRTVPWSVTVVAADPGLSFAEHELAHEGAGVLAAILLALAALRAIERNFTGPMEALEAAFSGVARGGSSVRVPPRGGRELRRQARSFNRMAEQLDASRTRMETLVRLSTDWVWETDAHHRFIAVDSPGRPGFEARRVLFIDQLAWEMGRAPDGERLVALREAMQRHEAVRDLLCRRDPPDSPVLTFLHLSAEPRFDARGAFLGYHGIARDVTELVLAQEKLRREQGRFAEMINAMHEGVFIVDRQGRIAFCNPAAERITGYPAEVICAGTIESPPWRRVGPDPSGAPARRQLLAAIVAERTAKAYQSLIRRRDGAEVYVDVHCVPQLGPDGEVEQVLVSFDDVTAEREVARRLAERQEDLELRVAARTRDLLASMNELNEITYTVSHDLRAPLRAIDGYASILGQGLAGADRETRQLIARVSDSARQMGRMVDALLEYANLGRRPPVRRAVVMNQCVGQALDELAQERHGRDVRFVIDELGVHVCDPAMVRELFRLLLDNALRFTRGRTPAVIRVDTLDLPHGRAWRVADNGVGFDMAFAGQLFRVFQNLGQPDGGMGIGLAMARRIVERHGGRIYAEGSPGMGASFVFTLGKGEA